MKATLGLLLRLALGGIFLVLSRDKLLYPAAFEHAVASYRLLPPALIPLFALVLPWLELVAGSALVLGLAPRGSALVLAGLSALFALATTSALLRHLGIACGCHRAWSLTWFHPLANLLLLLLALAVLRLGPGRWALAPREG